MKKSLFAIAAVGALTGVAQAQSSVTVYGIADAGYAVTNRSIAGTSTQTQATGTGQLATSRLGFRGSEDLGGGRSAIFTVELGLNLQGSNLSGSTNTANNATLDNRQSFVGLTDKELGTLKIGRQYSLAHEIIGASDAGYANGIIGANTYVGANSGTSWTATPITPNSSYSIRLSEAINYESPRIYGAQLKVQTAQNKSNSGVTQANAQGYTGFGLNWTGMGGNANIAASRAMNMVNTTATTATNVGFALLTNSAAVMNLKQIETAVGGDYNFGFARLFANYMQTEISGQVGGVNLSNNFKRTANNFGVRVPVKPNITVFGSYGGGSQNAFGTIVAALGSTQYNFRGFQVGSVYDLSKRTSLYAIYGKQSGDLSATTNFSANATAAGIRHVF